MTEPPDWPTHSQMGNPYPKALEPYVIMYEPPDKPNCRPQPLVEAEIPRPGGIVIN